VQKGDMAHQGRAKDIAFALLAESGPKSVRVRFELVRLEGEMRRRGAYGVGGVTAWRLTR